LSALDVFALSAGADPDPAEHPAFGSLGGSMPHSPSSAATHAGESAHMAQMASNTSWPPCVLMALAVFFQVLQT
jgi:hypothetical protein